MGFLAVTPDDRVGELNPEPGKRGRKPGAASRHGNKENEEGGFNGGFSAPSHTKTHRQTSGAFPFFPCAIRVQTYFVGISAKKHNACCEKCNTSWRSRGSGDNMRYIYYFREQLVCLGNIVFPMGKSRIQNCEVFKGVIIA